MRSKNFLTNLVLDKNVQINANKKDRYNRHLGEVYIHNVKERMDIFVNAKMLEFEIWKLLLHGYIFNIHITSYLFIRDNILPNAKFFGVENHASC